MSKNFGFTLVEILVVLSILALLLTVGLVSYGVVLKNARDAKRQSDLGVIQSALEQYHADQLFYPASIDMVLGGPLTNCTGNPPPCTVSKTYLGLVPKDPLGSPDYEYKSLPAGCDNLLNNRCQNFCLYSRLENKSAQDTACIDDPTRKLEVTKP